MSREQAVEAIQNAIRAHGAWKMRLRTAISVGRSDFTPETVACDDKCDFGKWLYGDAIPKTAKQGMAYKVVKRLHGEFHQTAGQVLREAVGGNADKSRQLLEGEFNDRSATLVRALTKWKKELQAA